MSIALLRFNEIPGIDLVQHVGEKLLGVAFVALLLHEIYKLVRGRAVDFGGPIARVAFGFLLIGAMPQITEQLSESIVSLSDTMQHRSTIEMFSRAIATAMDNASCEDTSFWDFFSFGGLVSMLASGVLVAMYVVKFIILDVLFPVMFGLVVYLGVLSIPIATFPGSSGVTGWFRNVIEVSLWPIIFQFLVALLAGSFPLIISAMANGHVVMDCGGVADSLSATAADAVSLDTGSAQPYATGVVAVLQFVAICCTYVVLLLFTPFLSGMVVRSAPVGFVGGIVAAKAGNMVMGLGKLGAGAGGNVFGTGVKATVLAGAIAAERARGAVAERLNRRG